MAAVSTASSQPQPKAPAAVSSTIPPLVPNSLACLCGKTVYLDVSTGDPNRQASLKFIKKYLRKQGAVVDDFFSVAVHYVFTDRPCCQDGASAIQLAQDQNALPSVSSYSGTNALIKKAFELNILVYRMSTIESWMRRNLRLMGCLSSSAGGGGGGDGMLSGGPSGLSVSHTRPSTTTTSVDVKGGNSHRTAVGASKPVFQPLNRQTSHDTKKMKVKPEKAPIKLQGAFIRLDDVTGEHRPFYHEMTAWPQLRLEPLAKGACSTAAAGGSPFVDPEKLHHNVPAIQPGPRLVAMVAEPKNKQNAPQAMRGYCEACSMVVADIDRHLQGEEHAKRIKKAAKPDGSVTKKPAAAALTRQNSSKQQSKDLGQDDFVRSLQTLDAVIAQHFGPTANIRMALLESYLEQAASEVLSRSEKENNSSRIVDDDDDEEDEGDEDDDGDEGDLHGVPEQDDELPSKRVRNEEKQPEEDIKKNAENEPKANSDDVVEATPPPQDEMFAEESDLFPEEDRQSSSSPSMPISEALLNPAYDSSFKISTAPSTTALSKTKGHSNVENSGESAKKPPVESNSSTVFDAKVLAEKLQRIAASKVDEEVAEERKPAVGAKLPIAGVSFYSSSVPAKSVVVEKPPPPPSDPQLLPSAVAKVPEQLDTWENSNSQSNPIGQLQQLVANSQAIQNAAQPLPAASLNPIAPTLSRHSSSSCSSNFSSSTATTSSSSSSSAKIDELDVAQKLTLGPTIADQQQSSSSATPSRRRLLPTIGATAQALMAQNLIVNTASEVRPKPADLPLLQAAFESKPVAMETASPQVTEKAKKPRKPRAPKATSQQLDQAPDTPSSSAAKKPRNTKKKPAAVQESSGASASLNTAILLGSSSELTTQQVVVPMIQQVVVPEPRPIMPKQPQTPSTSYSYANNQVNSPIIHSQSAQRNRMLQSRPLENAYPPQYCPIQPSTPTATFNHLLIRQRPEGTVHHHPNSPAHFSITSSSAARPTTPAVVMIPATQTVLFPGQQPQQQPPALTTAHHQQFVPTAFPQAITAYLQQQQQQQQSLQQNRQFQFAYQQQQSQHFTTSNTFAFSMSQPVAPRPSVPPTAPPASAQQQPMIMTRRRSSLTKDQSQQ